ncbi:MAG: YncE family protein [Clostridia bacterium]|nr:YncE family protein [Clostridia bacterium]
MKNDHHHGKLIVSNRASDTISIIDSKTFLHISDIKIKPLGNGFDKINYYKKGYAVGPHNLAYNAKNGMVYSTNCFDDSMSVIDIEKNSVSATFFVGVNPNDLAIDSHSSNIYITNSDSNTVSIVNSDENRLIGQLPVGLMPQGICINRDGSILAVANTDSNSISIINIYQGYSVSDIKLDFSPIKVIFSRDNDRLFISMLGDNSVGFIYIVDTNDFKIVSQIKVMQNPIHMAEISRQKLLYVCCMGDGYLCAVDLSQNKMLDCIKIGCMPHAIACDPEREYMYITDMKNDDIIKFNIKDFKEEDHIYCGKEPNGIIFI